MRKGRVPKGTFQNLTYVKTKINKEKETPLPPKI